METATCFVSRHNEPPPATLDELLKASKQVQDEQNDEEDSSSDFHDTSSEVSDADDEPEVDEWRLHAAEPQEGLYLREMRRQRGRMDEKEAQWVRGYLKAQRAWKARTGHSIDEFHVPDHVARRLQRRRVAKAQRSHSVAAMQKDEDEPSVSFFSGVTRVELLLLVAAGVFICLSLAVQLHASLWSEHKSSTD